MAYSTQSDILQVLSQRDLAQLTDDNDDNYIDKTIVNTQISKADNQIDTYLRGKHDLPFTTTPPRVTDWSVTLAIFNLYKRRIDLEIPEAIRIDYDNTIQELRDTRENGLLIDDSESSANTASYYKGNGTSKNQLFTSNTDDTGTLDEYYSGPA